MSRLTATLTQTAMDAGRPDSPRSRGWTRFQARLGAPRPCPGPRLCCMIGVLAHGGVARRAPRRGGSLLRARAPSHRRSAGVWPRGSVSRARWLPPAPERALGALPASGGSACSWPRRRQGPHLRDAAAPRSPPRLWALTGGAITLVFASSGLARWRRPPHVLALQRGDVAWLMAVCLTSASRRPSAIVATRRSRCPRLSAKAPRFPVLNALPYPRRHRARRSVRAPRRRGPGASPSAFSKAAVYRRGSSSSAAPCPP